MKKEKKKEKRWLLSLALLTLSFVPAVAQADGPPSRWQRAKEPEKMEDYRLHRSSQRMFPLIYDMKKARSDLYERYVRDLVTSLDAWNAATSSDVRLRVDLGRALEEQKSHRRAAEVLKSAVALKPDSPLMGDALLALGWACGHLGDHDCERDAYTQLLQIETEDVSRLMPLGNLAEVEMHFGNMKESIALYQETLRISAHVGANVSHALASWGLAVALDRTGDRNAAEDAARRALEISASLRRDLLHEEGVFFYPSYEVSYYEGVGAAAIARKATSAHAAAISWGAAERRFEKYVREAERTNPKDRFLGAAKARHASAKAEREKAEKKRAKEPLKRTDEEELPL